MANYKIIDDRIFKFTHYKSYNDFTYNSFGITKIEKALNYLMAKYLTNFEYLISSSLDDIHSICLYVKINNIYLYDNKIYHHKFYYDDINYQFIEINYSECFVKKNKNIIYKMDKWGTRIHKYKNNKLTSIKNEGKTIWQLYSIYRKNFKHIKMDYKGYRLNYIEYDKNDIYKFSRCVRFKYNYNKNNIYIIKKVILKIPFTHLIITNYRYIFLFI